MNSLNLNPKKAIITTACALFMLAAGTAQAQLSSVTIQVNDSSAAATGISSSAGTTLCEGESSVLQVTGGELGTGAHWDWFNEDPDANPGAVAIQSDIADTLSITPAVGTTTYYVRASGDCNTTNTASVAITVNPTPTADIVSNDTFCSGTTVNAVALTGTPTGVTFDITGGGDIGLADQTDVTEIPTFTATNNTTDVLTRTITITPKANGCTGTPITTEYTVLPQATLVATADQTVCSGVPVSVAFSSNSTPASGTITYEWEQISPDDIGNTTTTGTGDINFTAANPTNSATPNSNLTGIYEVTAVYTNGTHSCPSTADTFQITVQPEPYGSLTANSTICEGEPIQLTFTATTGTGAYSLEIKQDNEATNTTYNNVASGTPFDITPVPTSGGHTYDLMKITDANGCVKE